MNLEYLDRFIANKIVRLVSMLAGFHPTSTGRAISISETTQTYDNMTSGSAKKSIDNGSVAVSRWRRGWLAKDGAGWDMVRVKIARLLTLVKQRIFPKWSPIFRERTAGREMAANANNAPPCWSWKSNKTSHNFLVSPATIQYGCQV